MKSFDKANVNTDEVRNQVVQRIGEIITDILGKDQLQKVFEQPEHNAAYIEANEKGTPSGFIALDLGIVDSETKNALLVAQAAERTARNAMLAREVLAGNKIDEEQLISSEDDVFKYVGSDKDPQNLVEAQANWQISQIFLNATVHNQNAQARRDKGEVLGAPEEEFYFADDKKNATGAFLAFAAASYSVAAVILKSKGWEEAATKLAAVAESIDPDESYSTTPNDIAHSYRYDLLQYAQTMDITTGPGHVPDDIADLAEKLANLTSNQSIGSAPENKAKPANG